VGRDSNQKSRGSPRRRDLEEERVGEGGRREGEGDTGKMKRGGEREKEGEDGIPKWMLSTSTHSIPAARRAGITPCFRREEPLRRERRVRGQTGRRGRRRRRHTFGKLVTPKVF
jgi:hypothetical protein